MELTKERAEAVYEPAGVEVDQEAMVEIEELQRGHHLCLMKRYQLVDALQLYEQDTRDDEIRSIHTVEPDVFLNNRHGNISRELHPCQL
jgi:hypothetical protein